MTSNKLVIACPNCGQKVSYPIAKSGCSARCPSCRKPLRLTVEENNGPRLPAWWAAVPRWIRYSIGTAVAVAIFGFFVWFFYPAEIAISDAELLRILDSAEQTREKQPTGIFGRLQPPPEPIHPPITAQGMVAVLVVRTFDKLRDIEIVSSDRRRQVLEEKQHDLTFYLDGPSDDLESVSVTIPLHDHPRRREHLQAFAQSAYSIIYAFDGQNSDEWIEWYRTDVADVLAENGPSVKVIGDRRIQLSIETVDYERHLVFEMGGF